MHDLRSVELQSSIRVRPTPGSLGHKLATGLLVALITSAMIAWIGLLGWGAVAFLRWFVD